jgi:hypothetical protein
MPRKPGAHRGRKCQVCSHPERGRLDYLIVTGAGERGGGRRAIAARFGLPPASIYNHAAQHISAEYRAAILAGPFGSEEDPRRLAAEQNVSVLQNYRAVFNGHRSRWLRALEVGDDDAMVKHGRAMDGMLWRIGQLTREIQPHAVAIQNNLFLTPDYYTFERRAMKVLRRHPEALADWLSEFREVQRPALTIDVA